MTELNNIIDCIAPQNTRQVRKNYLPYMTKELRQRQQTVKNLHTTAKNTNDYNDWLNSKNSNAKLKKDIDSRQKQFITNKLDNRMDMWSTVKDINNTNKAVPPEILFTKINTIMIFVKYVILQIIFM